MAHGDPESPQRSQPRAASLEDTRHDSWIEVSSRSASPSQSSATDEIITTGLRVRTAQHSRRKRTGTAAMRSRIVDRASSATGSSQDEYEESESESDRVMTSSNEGLPPHHLEHEQSYPSRESHVTAGHANEDDEDERRTTLGVLPNEQCFTPQPNAFSHPPSSHSLQAQTSSSSNGYFTPADRPSIRTAAPHRHSFPARGTQHSPLSGISRSHGDDNDEVLRTSLNTLLSYAAAARGLPKRNSLGHPARTYATSRIEPSTLRLVPESVLLGEEEAADNQVAHDENIALVQPRPVTRRISSGSNSQSDDSAAAAVSMNAHATPASHKAKSRSSRSSNKERRARKQRHAAQAAVAEDLIISPTLFTWVLSAGILVVFSALSFSAGFALGRERGRMEGTEAALNLLNEAEGADVAACGRELLSGSVSGLGLRRLQFSSPVGVVH